MYADPPREAAASWTLIVSRLPSAFDSTTE